MKGLLVVSEWLVLSVSCAVAQTANVTDGETFRSDLPGEGQGPLRPVVTTLMRWGIEAIEFLHSLP